ncbi:MAG: hypothetical protein COW73_11870 [Nitrospirae bacterium CG18_big_fil_WC_8_21_14_2_50_70_55]|nr:Hsp20/alpha crystallin family protein [Deltaproteobacteria bacterium]OIP63783.1 MAG: hypothetical protein AUK30_07885 [Nitrospirae bacterium CG2_30_70_394]PIQ03057.1 MAG: hypothetical protein COW73_11870 [Nitrospirae bacterium CG18_big_fil_WC_8_21_14_2_50_70_55]PIU77866.1 MAG: hypothetical protein COS73_08765 [Nitrospirae bacterium CG06_land_8_20_14_3_00_70_43]PIW83557.1 MAG: hypothetical protein COZ96_02700 [Nitrospirae bacterium CG_4_8_14_3_um_filter_70_85]PIX84126.1 MAG: hypothetical pro
MALRDLIPRRRATRSLPVRHDEVSPILALHDEMDRLFDDVYRTFAGGPLDRFAPATQGYMPHMDVSEDDKSVVVTAELPGMEASEIDIALTGDLLTLKGEKREEHETKAKDYVRTERTFGAFRRTLELPCEVEEKGATATFKKGVLTITLPKNEQARGAKHRIEVQAA